MQMFFRKNGIKIKRARGHDRERERDRDGDRDGERDVIVMVNVIERLRPPSLKGLPPRSRGRLTAQN